MLNRPGTAAPQRVSRMDVIVPCYRYGRFLRDCVESALGQQGVELRVLIIDDCSPDNTAEVSQQLMAEDSRVSLIRHTSNRGHIATYNEGIEWIASDYYLLLSADDYLLPNAFGRTAAFMDRHPTVSLAFGQAIVAKVESGVQHSDWHPSSAPWELVPGRRFIERSGARNCVPTPAAVVRTAVQKQVGGYRPELPHSGDMEMWLRLATQGDVGITQAPHAVYRRHADNMSLGYMESHWLPDIRQRQAALAFFYSESGCQDDEMHRLKHCAYGQLSKDATRFANSAFNKGDLATSKLLSDLAVELSPEIRNSVAWGKLAAKRALGVTNWASLRSSCARLRVRSEGTLQPE